MGGFHGNRGLLPLSTSVRLLSFSGLPGVGIGEQRRESVMDVATRTPTTDGPRRAPRPSQPAMHESDADPRALRLGTVQRLDEVPGMGV